MRSEEYEKMFNLENTYWWYQGRKEIVLQFLLRHTQLGRERLNVLDVGCGTGLLLEELLAHANPVGVDFSNLAMDYCRQRGIEQLTRARVEAMPFGEKTFDLMLALDLLEHVEDDGGLIRELWRICRPGGHLLITVPAYPFLWSEHDEALQHCRRYTRASLRKLIGATGFETVRFSSAITFMLPPIVAFRVVQRNVKRKGAPKTHLIRLPRAFNQMLIGVLKLESRLLRHVNFPAGVSIVALLKKPA